MATPNDLKDQEERKRSEAGGRSEERRAMEDELRDPSNPIEYLLPRPLRQWFLWGSGASSVLAALAALTRLSEEGGLKDLAIDLTAAALFIGLALADKMGAEVRVERRREIREAQIKIGDREVFVNEEGEKMSRLKEVNDEWIQRRLERWGRKDNMPFLGPKKGAVLQSLVEGKQPRLAIDVGTMAGYSALLIAQSMPPDGRVVSLEKELMWVLVGKRFMWQAGQGSKDRQPYSRIGHNVDVRWGDALQTLPQMAGDASIAGKVDLLLLDGVPKEYLAYLKAAEPLLAPGALVIADNAGVFKDGGLKPYLEYVRGSPQYKSEFVESTLEWRDDVPDGLEVSVYQPS
ncbi:hypothetical protein FOA52_003373 [Chlamydomonas sp. UWO 241]|nr:hypothetical protein FOA52_003373 [Chlamydomonas sp. UWO 241]